MFSKYQYKPGDYLQQNSNSHQYCNQSSKASEAGENSDIDSEKKDNDDNDSSNDNNETAVELFKNLEREPLSKNERERVMRHFAKIILAKAKDSTSSTSASGRTSASLSQPKDIIEDDAEKVQDTEQDDENVKLEAPTATSTTKTFTMAGENVSLSAYPPPQLVITLRKIYGSPSSDRLNELEDADGGGSNTTGSSILPNLIQSIVDHPVFSNEIHTGTSNVDEEGMSEEQEVMKKAKTDDTRDGNSDNLIDEKEMEDSQHHFHERKVPFNDHSPVANLEAVIGNACRLVSESTSDNQNDENIVGVLIAALSILTSCITAIDGDIEANSLDSMTSGSKDYLNSFQVAGPLSFHVDTLKKSSFIKDDHVLKSNSFSDLLLHPILMNYFFDAASIYEEREEKNKAQRDAANKVEKAEKDANKETVGSKIITETSGANEVSESNSIGSNVYSGDSNERVSAAEPEQEGEDDEHEFQEPHGYSFIEEEDDDDDNDDEDNSSQDDDESSVSTSSRDDHGDGDDEVQETENSNDELISTGNITESSGNEVIADADKEATGASKQVETEEKQKDQIEEELLLQALAMSYGDTEQALPQLPAYPKKEYHPSDPFVLNPSSIDQFGKLSASVTFTSLMRLALLQTEKQRQKQEKRSNACNLTIHIIVAILHTLSTSRAETTKLLSDLVNKLDILKGKGRKEIEEISEDEDPAFGTAPSVASAHSTSASLEEKGMIRKAAAAAHSVSIQQEKLQQDIQKLRESLKFFSLSSYLVMKCLRNIIQQIILSPTHQESYKLSMITRVRLTACLSSYMSTGLSIQMHSLSSYFSDINHTSIPRILFFEAASLWGECAPLIFASASDLESQLKRSLRQCFPSIFDDKAENPELRSQKDISLPWSDADTNFLKLNSMCQRMRCQEILDYYIVAPKAFNKYTGSFERKGTFISIYKMLSKICLNQLHCYESSVTENISGLFYAFHARCTQDLLLWRNAEPSAFNSSLNEPNESTESVDSESKVIALKKQSFRFDSSKCAESIALVSSIRSNVTLTAHQRASKVWGTVFSTTSFEPKSGVHRWAVRLDKCERGHVFVGVVTSRASKKTYVGGDKHGWGVIGTQALWHERRKVRSDYGNTFRTGATVVVTLDTDAGTLRFGILHKSHHSSPSKNSSPFEIDRSPFNDGRLDDSSGYIEDWGIAFEGLPVDTKLFPAVGLYQRDDKVTLLSVSTESNDGADTALLNDLVSGSVFYPETSKLRSDDNIEELGIVNSFRKWNSNVCDDGITFAANVLKMAIERLELQTKSIPDDDFFQRLFPSVISSLALYPGSVPVLSGRFSMTLLPLICRCLHLVEGKIDSNSVQLNPIERIKAGKWTIRAGPSTSSICAADEIEEYVVDLEYCGDKSCFQGNGIGTGGKSINCKVSIVGASNGSLIKFVEEWADESDVPSEANLSTSTCVAEAELNIFGTRFEGQYTNVHYGKSGSISGILESSNDTLPFEESQQCLVSCSALLGMAVSHFSSILSSGAPKTDVGPKMNQDFKITKDHLEELQLFVKASHILSHGLTIQAIDDTEILSCIQNVLSHFLSFDDKTSLPDVSSYWRDLSLPFFIQSKEVHDLFNDDALSTLDAVDKEYAPICGGYGSLSMLEPEVYKKCRQNIISVLLHHTGKRNMLSLIKEEGNSELSAVWHTALQIIETGVRSTLFQLQDGSSRKKGCIRYCKLADSISSFLMKIIPLSNALEITLKGISEIYAFTSRQKDVLCFAEIIESRNRRDLLRFLGLSVIQKCIGENIQSLGTIEALISSWQQSNREFDHFTRHKENSSAGISNYVSSSDKLYQIKFNVLSSISSNLTKLLNAKSIQDGLSVTSLQSLSLTILPSLFDVNKSNITDFPGTTIWSYVHSLVTECEKVVYEQDLNGNNLKEAEIIHKSMICCTRLNIMNSITSVLHLYLYLIHDTVLDSNEVNLTKVTATPMNIVKDELKKVFALMKVEYESKVNDGKLHKAGTDCDLWISTHAKNVEYCVERVKECTETGGKFSSGLSYISTKENMANRIQTDNKMESATYLCERNLVRLLNILSSLVHSKHFSIWLKNDEWIELLTNFMICQKGIFSPFRLRMRVIRLLRIILPNSSPNVALIEKLFSRIGTIMLSLDIDSTESPEVEYIEAKELVSLLRTMHNNSNSTEADLDWCDCIYKAIENNSDAILRGFQTYLGGVPDKVAIGSCVLLKPSAAANITAASSQASYKHNSGKSKSLFESMAPVAASSGAEGIIAGLCRREALAGRISDLDVKSGVCEIVLFERQGLKTKNRQSSGSISIRAVKVPCQEIVAADEIALLINERLLELSKISNPAIQGLIDITSALNQTEEKESDKEHYNGLEYERLINAIFSTRVSTVVLSNPSFLKVFLHDHKVKESECMRKLLDVASLKKISDESLPHSSSASDESLGTLPEYHSRFWYLRGILSEVTQRKAAFNSIEFEKLCKTSKKSDIEDSLVTPNKEKPDETNFVTLQGSFRDDNNNASDTIDEIVQRQEIGTERTGFQSNSVESTNDDDDDENNGEDSNSSRLAEETEAAHLREAAIVQMAELVSFRCFG